MLQENHTEDNFKFSEQLNRIFIAAAINRLILNGVGYGHWDENESQVSSLFATSTYKELQVDHFCSEKFLRAITNGTNISEVKIFIAEKLSTEMLSTFPRVVKSRCINVVFGEARRLGSIINYNYPNPEFTSKGRVSFFTCL
ncbi:hypothetical protein PFISCL1PPCAC_17863 [Pristionchus fissidentatus]|uniref:Uncharacterized protein n=1 Tax=Pristionchus fissidentatus TaxID=1538716 RepID=A0AAV5W331_9BILA|nr:hypothetical protein PFISCL1PPCAC_17863 [Pristionchus fissidentatus]